MPVLRDWDVAVTTDQVLKAQGADPQVVRSRRPALVEVAEQALREGLPLVEAVVLYERFEVEALRHERLSLTGEGDLCGRLIAEHLGAAEGVIAAVCTIGSQLEWLVFEVIREDALLGQALDAVGTAAVEALAGEVCAYFERQAAAAGEKTTLPLSPGMIGWPVRDGQAQIFGLLEPESIGVRLTSSLMMVPGKSLSMVIGIGPEAGVEGVVCDFCAVRETCRYQDHYR